jgi:hypothetical protein
MTGEKGLIDGIREVLAIYHEHGYLPIDATAQSEFDDEPVDACDALCSMVETLLDRLVVAGLIARDGR